ncbi:hydroxypyruvate isomerase [Deltaproteobacteria bacterium Smac51]|nr:hydroxypyruvate isomerase [Deltaproteobacteria bacterium Smac51]
MPKFSVNLSMLFTERPFPERFQAAAEAGFSAVEFMFPYDYPAETCRAWLCGSNLKLALFNLPAGDFAGGERGLAVLKERESDFRQSVFTALEYAEILEAPRMNCLTGLGAADENDDGKFERLTDRLGWAADEFAKRGMTLLVEFINNYDMPAFYLNSLDRTVKLIKAVGRGNLKIQYDVYHAQRSGGELLSGMRTNLDLIGHVQIADNPGRHQPGTGEINYPNVFKALDDMGYEGWVGLEYIPLGGSNESLAWIEQFSLSRK